MSVSVSPAPVSLSSSLPSPSVSSSSPSSAASSSASFPPSASVWSTLLSRASRKRDLLPPGSVILLGDRGTGKSNLLTKFSDRVHSGSSTHSNPNNVNTPSNNVRDYVVDYSVLNVKNRFNADKDEILTHCNVWQLDEATQADLIPVFLKSNLATQNQAGNAAAAVAVAPPPSASSVASPAPSTASVSSTPAPVPTPSTAASTSSSSGPYSTLFTSSQFPHSLSSSSLSSITNFNIGQSLETTIFLITIDLSEPWKALESTQKWLNVLQKFKDTVYPRLSLQEQKRLQDRISYTVQSYYNADITKETNTNTNESLNNNENNNNNTDSSLIGDEKEGELNRLNASIPRYNLGFPVVFVGTRSDIFSRNLKDKSNTDDRLEYFTRKLRQLALQYGAALIYTSCPGRGHTSNTVGVEILQSYIYHRLYQFPLIQSQPPKAVASEEDFALFIPAGFDSTNLIDSTSSKQFPDDMAWEEVFKNPVRGAKGSSASSPRQLETIKAQDNVLFFKTIKFALENGQSAASGGAGGIQGFPRQISASQAAAAELKAKVTAELKASAITLNNASAAAGSSSSASSASPPPAITITDPTGSSKSAAGSASNSAASTPSHAAAAGGSASAAAAAMKNPKGQIAVKQFFRSLLNNNPGVSTSKDGAAAGAKDPKVMRANAEKELRKMTGGGAGSSGDAQ